MPRRIVFILVGIILLLLVTMQVSGLLVRFQHHRYCSFTIEQSKAAQLFVKELDLAKLPEIKEAWIERQCDYYSIGFMFFDIASRKRIRNDYALVLWYNQSNRQLWPKYNNVNLLINLNDGCLFSRFKTMEEIDPSKITIGPANLPPRLAQ